MVNRADISIVDPTTAGRIAGVDALSRLLVTSTASESVDHSTTTITNSTAETTIIAGVASETHNVLSLVITNASPDTPVTVTIRDATSGTVRMIIALATNGGISFNPVAAMSQAAAGDNWTATLSVNTVTVYIFAMWQRA